MTQPSQTSKSSQTETQRYLMVDAMRGVAALAVMLHHMLHNSVMEVTLRRTIPAILLWPANLGTYGVQIFFVLSGFVIAHSLRNNQLTRQSIGNFVLRRQLRLDPCYWVTIVFVLMVHVAEKKIFPFTTPPIPHAKEVLLNFFYLQNITGTSRFEGVVGVAWTLCIEVQFYLVFISLLKVGQQSSKTLKLSSITRATIFLMLSSGMASVAFNLWRENSPWFIQHWFYFAAGVLCYWSVTKRIHPISFYVLMATFGLSIVPSVLWGLGYHGAPALAFGFSTLILLYVAGKRERLTTWGSNVILQYFGRISYSLYLVHVTVAVAVLKFGYKLTGTNHPMSVVWFVASGLVSVAAGHLLYIAVEKPSMRLAQSLKQMPSQEVINDTLMPLPLQEVKPVIGSR